LDKERLRVKSGRSKGCKDCIAHRCIPNSCKCDCHCWWFYFKIMPMSIRFMCV